MGKILFGLLIVFLIIFCFLNFYPRQIITVSQIPVTTYNYRIFTYGISINKKRNTFFISKKVGTDIFFHRERTFPFPIKFLMPFSDVEFGQIRSKF